MNNIPTYEFCEEDMDTFEVDRFAEYDYPGFDDRDDPDKYYHNILCSSNDKHTLIQTAIDVLHGMCTGCPASYVMDKAYEILESFGLSPDEIFHTIDDRHYRHRRVFVSIDTDDLPF